MTDHGAYFRRPRTAGEIRDANLSVQASRAVKDEKLVKVGNVWYYRRGWFEKLGDNWDVKDVFLNLMLLSARQLEIVSRSKQWNNTRVGLVKVADSLRTMAHNLISQADELDRRAELLDVEGEESQTEAAD